MAEDDEPKKWEKKDGRWRRVSEDAEAREADEATRYFELPDGEVVREDLADEELAPDHAEAEPEPDEEPGRFAGLLGGGEEPPGEPEPGEAEEPADEEERSRAPAMVAGVVIIVLLLLMALLGAAIANIADPLGLRDQLGFGGDDDGPPGATNGDGNGGGGNQTPQMFVYPVTWSTSDDSATRSGSVSDGDASNATSVTVADRNLTNVTVTLTWDDSEDDSGAGGQSLNDPDTLRLTVESPDGDSDSAEAANGGDGQGQITLNFSLASIPSSPTEITSDSRANATSSLLSQQPPTMTGTGEWSITVEWVNGGNTCDPNLGSGTDCSQDWDLSFEWSWYDATLGTGTPVES